MPFSGCEVEVDESYFGAYREWSKRGRGASGKIIVFGLFKHNGCVYTEVLPDCKKATLQAIICGRVAAEAVINSDGWRGYDDLVAVGYSIIELIIATMTSFLARITSMALRASGVMLREDFRSSMEFPIAPSTYI